MEVRVVAKFVLLLIPLVFYGFVVDIEFIGIDRVLDIGAGRMVLFLLTFELSFVV